MWVWNWIKWLVHLFFPKKPLLLPYENTYPLNSTLPIEETEENLKRRHVQEMTLEGLVTMTYDAPSASFFYWSEKKIAYKYLEVVARKFVLLYNCKEVYINMFRELLKTLPKRRLMKERANVYKYCGTKYEEVKAPCYKQISYLDYKKNNPL
jgi:hypothetical protein